MAVEQDWAAYGDQLHLKANDTILARTVGGAGVEIPGVYIAARRFDGGPYQASGGHNDSAFRVYSTGDGGIDDANVDIFASHPGVSYGGGGVGYNININRAAGKRRPAQGASCLEFASDGGFSIYQATTAQANLLQRIRLSPAGVFSVICPTGGGITINNTDDFERGGVISANGGGGNGNVYFGTSSSGYDLRFGIDGVTKQIIHTNGRVTLNGASANYSFNMGDSNPGRGIIADLTNFSGSPNGAMLSFTQNGINNWCLGQIPGVDEFGVYRGRNGLTDGALIARWDSGGSYLPGADNARNLGSGSFRMAVIYATTGTINTSDAREKFWLRSGLTEAELRAAIRIFKEIGSFQWNDAIEEKGVDEARIHFGVRAQSVWAIMAEEKLVKPISDKTGRPGKTPYAFLCYDKWDDEYEAIFEDIEVEKTRTVQIVSKIIDPSTGQGVVTEMEETYIEVENRDTGEKRLFKEAGDRYGIRETQLQWFLMAALAHKLEL